MMKEIEIIDHIRKDPSVSIFTEHLNERLDSLQNLERILKEIYSGLRDGGEMTIDEIESKLTNTYYLIKFIKTILQCTIGTSVKTFLLDRANFDLTRVDKLLNNGTMLHPEEKEKIMLFVLREN